jgi:3-deoxy-D-manno-octulosonate 8-phosphate phosphatase (KDO 8-P phosphatase)
MAAASGLRLMVRRDASPMFADYVERHGLCDYVTAQSSGCNAVREVCELLLGLMDIYDDVVGSRVASDDKYDTYLGKRQSVLTRCYTREDVKIGM